MTRSYPVVPRRELVETTALCKVLLDMRDSSGPTMWINYSSEEWQGVILSWYFSNIHCNFSTDWTREKLPRNFSVSWNPLRMDGEFEKREIRRFKEIRKNWNWILFKTVTAPTNWTLEEGEATALRLTANFCWSRNIKSVLLRLNISKNEIIFKRSQQNGIW